MADVIERSDVESFIVGLRGYLTSVRYTRGDFHIGGYVDGKNLCDANHASGSGTSLAKALTSFNASYDKIERGSKKLTTAAECKAAVIDLIIEHNASPDAFRDAVDALKVSDR